jgi:hypothetical protein
MEEIVSVQPVTGLYNEDYWFMRDAVMRSDKLVAVGTQRKKNVGRWKPLPSNS